MSRVTEWVFPKTCGSCLELSSRVRELEAQLESCRDRYKSKRIDQLEAERDRLKNERDEAREFVTMRLEDMNKDGKTILDFYAFWLRQSRDSYTKLRTRHAALVEAAEPFVSTFHHTRLFLQSKEKMHKDGVRSYEDDVNKLKAALAEARSQVPVPNTTDWNEEDGFTKEVTK